MGSGTADTPGKAQQKHWKIVYKSEASTISGDSSRSSNGPVPPASLPSPSHIRDQAFLPPSNPPSTLCLCSPWNSLHACSPGRECSGESCLAQVLERALLCPCP